MKRCPECRRDYYDDSLLYCLEDGIALLQGAVSSPDEPSTAILDESMLVGEAPTHGQIHTTDKTATLPSYFASVRHTKGFNKWLVVAPLVLIVVALSGVVGY